MCVLRKREVEMNPDNHYLARPTIRENNILNLSQNTFYVLKIASYGETDKILIQNLRGKDDAHLNSGMEHNHVVSIHHNHFLSRQFIQCIKNTKTMKTQPNISRSLYFSPDLLIMIHRFPWIPFG